MVNFYIYFCSIIHIIIHSSKIPIKFPDIKWPFAWRCGGGVVVQTYPTICGQLVTNRPQRYVRYKKKLIWNSGPPLPNPVYIAYEKSVVNSSLHVVGGGAHYPADYYVKMFFHFAHRSIYNFIVIYTFNRGWYVSFILDTGREKLRSRKGHMVLVKIILRFLTIDFNIYWN